MKLAATVVMYNPEIYFLDNIQSYLGYIQKLYIIDNSENPRSDFFKALIANPKVELISNATNYGIAKAINIAAAKSTSDGYDWLMTMDQDSFFEKMVLEQYLNYANSYSDKRKVAIFGLPYDKNFLRKVPPEEKYVQVDSLITSGSLVNLEVLRELKGFNEKLFIDEVDHEYCFRANESGYKVVCIRTGFLSHSLGEKISASGIITGKSTIKTLHNPLRIYYIIRNGLYISKRFRKSFPDQAKKRKKLIYVTVKNNLLYGHEKTAVIKYTILGFWHYVKNRYYKL